MLNGLCARFKLTKLKFRENESFSGLEQWLLHEIRPRRKASSSVPIAELDNAALFIRETEWLYSLYSSPLAVNQGN